jgi:hypothetical protein
MASKVNDAEYNLLLQNDINTSGYSQWFFFKVSNTRAQMKVKFKILNQYKSNNLYKMGMKIILYSKKESELKNLSWHRGGENIEYYENGYSKTTTEYKPFFTLSWDYSFPHDDDELYFAYSYPYTFSNLENFFFKIESDSVLRSICQRTALCKTLAGNRVDILTITENHPRTPPATQTRTSTSDTSSSPPASTPASPSPPTSATASSSSCSPATTRPAGCGRTSSSRSSPCSTPTA